MKKIILFASIFIVLFVGIFFIADAQAEAPATGSDTLLADASTGSEILLADADAGVGAGVGAGAGAGAGVGITAGITKGTLIAGTIFFTGGMILFLKSFESDPTSNHP